MKRLVVCCDGTWNNSDQEDNGVPAPTNVFKLHNAVAESDTNNALIQLKYYHPGVGGEGGLARSVLGGAIGAGISRHICSAYHWIGANYEEGDEIFLFGFSRGAFTIRSLCGFLSNGLLNLQNLESEESWDRVDTAYKKGYRKSATIADWSEPEWQFFHQKEALPIHFIGVWETVGALGVPDDLEIFNLFDIPKRWRFHDTKLKPNVKTARHAMALDEIRSSFSVARWENAHQHTDAIELWFPGAHSDVGGGYAECDLSNGALLWMMEESANAGLAFRQSVQASIKSEPLGVMHNSYKGAMAKLRSRPRNIDAMLPYNKERFHSGALERQRVSPINYPAYHPTRILDVGESHSVDIYADTRWNETGLYLPKDHSFTFSATGEWQDSKDTCDWKGTQDDKLSVGDIVRGASSFLGKFEAAFRAISNNEATDFLGTKRVEALKWFSMVGAITNDVGELKVVKHDGSPSAHQYINLPDYETLRLVIDHPGYLYCFPNDVWSLYGNNHGSVRLTIRREA